MGPEQTSEALIALQQNDLAEVCRLCLIYYDKTYDHGLQKRENLNLKKHTFESEGPDDIAQYLINHCNDRVQTN